MKRRFGYSLAVACGLATCSSVHAFSWFQFDGADVIWPGGTADRYLSPGTFPPGSDTLTMIVESMGLWTIVPGADFLYQYALLDQDYPIDNYDGFSDTAAVSASALDPGVLGVTYLVNDGAAWFDMDMLFSDFPGGVGWNLEGNPSCEVVANPAPSNGYSFLLVAVHEMGHALGLGHEPIGNEPTGTSWFIATMNPRYPSGGPLGQGNIVELHADDRNGLRYLYPHSGPSGPLVRDLAGASFTSSAVIGRAVPIHFSPASILPGEVLTARSVIENFGASNEIGVSQGFYLSTDEIIETTDVSLGSLLWDLAVGDGFEFDVEIDMPSDLAAGTYHLGYILDDLDQVVEEYEDNNDAVYCDALTVAQLAPVVNDLGQESPACGEAYTGPAPVVTHPLNMAPITWSIDNPEPGMTIDPATGVLRWPAPVRSEFLYTIYLRATNGAGSVTQVLFLGVTESSPEIADLTAPPAACGVPYVGPAPAITEPSCMEPIINWSLDDGPDGMTIDFETGVVSWDHPVREGSPHSVTIRATNGAGNGTYTFSVPVLPTTDRDGDGDTDLVDYAVFAGCLAGPGAAADGSCACGDLDSDGDVDLFDMAAFGRAFDGVPQVGACCASDTGCTELTAVACLAGGGVYRGDNTTCAEEACTGACCLSNGFCLDVGADACAGAEGTYHGTGTACAATACE